MVVNTVRLTASQFSKINRPIFTTLYNVCAVPWGCSVPWGLFSTVGDIMSTVGDIMINVGGYLEYRGVFSTVGVS